MSCYEEVNIPLMRGCRKLQIICHNNFHKTGNSKQFWKRCLERLILTLNIMLESNFGAIPHLKFSVARKLPPALHNILLKPHFI